MALKLDTLDALLSHPFDTVIDVRSPSEYAEDHLPGAINLPVLDDAERARVGTVYKQKSPFLARKIGAALVFQNAAQHIAGPLADHDGGWQPLVYCWRGGQRSGSFSWMLQQIGWRAETLPGGYKTFRRLVQKTLYDQALAFRFVQLGGYTGTGKTELLQRLDVRGVQILDLEGLARHRGSLLGDVPGGQPSQKRFETALVRALHKLDPERPVVVEAESSKIGALNLPPSLWSAMRAAPWIEVVAPLPERARYLAQAYSDVLADSDVLMAKLAPLRRHRGHALVDHWAKLSASGARLDLCQTLAADHYDPAYDKSMRAIKPRIVARLQTPALDPNSLDDLAGHIEDRLQRIDTTPV